MKSRLKLFCHAALIVVIATTALADSQSSWFPGSDPLEDTDTKRVAHYAVPGMRPNDKATVTLTVSGQFPISFYDIRGILEGSFSVSERLRVDYPEVWEIYNKECLLEIGLDTLLEERELCIIEKTYADATLSFSFLFDVSSLHNVLPHDVPGIKVKGLGIADENGNQVPDDYGQEFVALIETKVGMACSGSEDASICVSCFSDFRALAAQDAGAVCGDPELLSSLIVLDARIPYFTLISEIAGYKRKWYEQWTVVVRMYTAKPSHYSFLYDGNELLEALFSPR